MPEWGIALIGVAGIIVGVLITEVRNWLDRKQRFRVMTFEKRLEAHQKAYYWCQKRNEVLNISENAEIHKTAREAREWWNANCLFLDAQSRSEMVGLLNLAHYYADDMKFGKEVWPSLRTTLKAIVRGIGVEYLPEMSQLPEELEKTM